MKATGKFIAICGGEGSGKGTISSHLQSRYTEKGVIFSREPGGTPLAEKLRKMIFDETMSVKTELLLFEAARADHLSSLIIPSLESGKHVIVDRFDACSYAYQICGRENIENTDAFRFVNDWVVTRAPDLYLFCDIDPALALKRRMETGEVNRFDKEELSFHQRVHDGYKQFFSSQTKSRVVSVDTSLGKEEMCRIAEEVVSKELGF